MASNSTSRTVKQTLTTKGTELSATAPAQTNWNLCIISRFPQRNSSVLTQSSRGLIYSAGVGYKALAALLENFQNIGHFPIDINISRLDLGDGIARTLIAQQAKWHKSCWLKFSQTTLERAKKRKASDDIGKTHSSLR